MPTRPHASKDDWADAPRSAVAGTGCDALILGRGTLDPLDYAVNWNTPPVRFLSPDSLRETVARWLGYYTDIGAGAVSYGAVILRRRMTGTPWVSSWQAGSAPGDRASEQLLRAITGHDLSAAEDSALLARRFSLPDGTDVTQRFARRQGRFHEHPAMISLDAGLGVTAAVDPDVLDVIFACDGQRTLFADRSAVRGTPPDARRCPRAPRHYRDPRATAARTARLLNSAPSASRVRGRPLGIRRTLVWDAAIHWLLH